MEFKRVYKYLVSLSVGVLLVACSPDNGAVDEAEAPTEEVTDETAAEETTPKDEKTDEQATDETATDETKETADMAEVSHQIDWEKIGELPAPDGYDENIGVAGIIGGVIDGKIVTGGGANFPDGPPTEGGEKVIHKDLYLFDVENGDINVLDQISYEYGLGYGASVVHEDTLYYVGGGETPETSADVLAITTENDKLQVEKIGELEVPFENGIAEYHDGKIYYGVGKLDGEASSDFYAFDIESGENTLLAAFPGAARSQSVSEIFGNEIVVFGGGSSVTYQDGYRYNIEEDTWEELANVAIDGQEISVLGADSTKISDTEMLVVGGFDEEVWNRVNADLADLEGEEKDAYMKEYYSHPVEYYNWNKQMLVYNIETDEWTTLGEISFDAPAGAALLKDDENVYSIMGEIKPTVRTPNIYQGVLQ